MDERGLDDRRRDLSESQEDYLKQVYLLGATGTAVSTQALAERLAVRPASVTGMVRRLAELDLLDHVPYRGVRLTERGRLVALEMLRHHRLLETFLVQSLGYSWDQVHDEAERLEHVISERFEDRIAELLGHPSRDPHGDPIPTVDLDMPDDTDAMSLTEPAPGSWVTLVRVRSQDPDGLAYLERLGFRIGVRIRVLGRTADPPGVRIEIGGGRMLVPEATCRQLDVTEEDMT